MTLLRSKRDIVSSSMIFVVLAVCLGSASWMIAEAFHTSSSSTISSLSSIRSSATSSATTTTASQLFMNNKKKSSNKKKRTSKNANGQGFGGSSGAVASAAASKIVDRFPYAGTIRPGKQSPQRIVIDSDIVLPDYANDGIPKKGRGSPLLPWIIEVKTPQEITKMRAAGKLARDVLDMAGRAVDVGVTTDEIDALVHEATIKAGAYPSPLNYHGFPKSCCTSVNEVICHGIPDDRQLEAGDVINLDITVYLDGYHGDCSEMFVVGGSDAIDSSAKQLLQTTYDCWIMACQYVQPGKDYKDLGAIIEDYVTANGGFSSVKNFCGHGIGSVFHTTPNILHYRNNEPNGQMAPGHTFTIEPMICEGSNKVLSWKDDWTATTIDGKKSAQFEHTLLVTPDGVEAFTAKNENSMLQFWEKESNVYKGFWLGTSQSAMERADEINSKLDL